MFFTSDTHFGHANIIKYCNRPFKNVHEMNEALIEAWNKKVPKNAEVKHLGDFSFKGGDPAKYFYRLNGKIEFILGNHDVEKDLRKLARVDMLRPVKFDKQKIWLCHYAMRTWSAAHHGTWHLYGHSHNSLEHIPHGKSMDVGVDSAAALGFGYAPLHFDEIKEILDKRSVLRHH